MMFGHGQSAPCDERESRRIVDAFLEAGGNFIDTANVFVGGESEEVVGRAIKDQRDQVVLATKGYGSIGEGPNSTGLGRKYLIPCTELVLPPWGEAGAGSFSPRSGDRLRGDAGRGHRGHGGVVWAKSKNRIAGPEGVWNQGGVAVTKADELQNVPTDEFWERFEAVMGGPDGLMTYRYLGTQTDLDHEGGVGGMTIRRDMRNP